MKTVLVVGATGTTGKFVVQQLLDKGHNVRVVARSKERMMSLLNNDDSAGDRLSVTEASLLDLPESKLQELTDGCDGTYRIDLKAADIILAPFLGRLTESRLYFSQLWSVAWATI